MRLSAEVVLTYSKVTRSIVTPVAIGMFLSGFRVSSTAHEIDSKPEKAQKETAAAWIFPLQPYGKKLAVPFRVQFSSFPKTNPQIVTRTRTKTLMRTKMVENFVMKFAPRETTMTRTSTTNTATKSGYLKNIISHFT